MQRFDPSQLPGPGSLSEEQWRQLDALAAALTPRQALWLSGFFAGLERARGADAALVDADFLSPEARGDAAAESAPAAPARTLTILYGTETGNSAALARAAAEQALALGLKAKVADMADYKVRQLAEEQDVLLIASTYGDGDPPQPATPFFEFLEGRKAPSLAGVRFGVLALGDSTYEKYCEAGKRLDRRFAELGASALAPRVDCDVDYDEAAAAWTADVLSRLAAGQDGPRAEAAVVAAQVGVRAKAAPSVYDKRNPFAATVIENLVLTGRGSSKETRHVELSLQGSKLAYEPGDALGMMARNDPAVVGKALAAAGLAGDSLITLKDAATPLAKALEENFEIAALTPRFLEHWAELSGAGELRALIGEERARERALYLHEHHVVDVIRAFPVKGLGAEAFVAGLRPLQPRLYSIASSLAANPGEAHLTVSTVRYALHGETRFGVASGYFARHAPVDSAVPVYIQSNPHFRLAAGDAPIVMIGAGTGVAPFRAFMQEREAQGAGGKSWLFFGERNFGSDFLYQIEWQQYLKDKLLTRMEVAFSRDRWGKAYVQHKMLEQAKDLYGWLEEGAHVYVCGDAMRLAPDVHDALVSVVETQGSRSREAAEDYVRELAAAHRYQRDVY